ncbi:MAG TPA: TlyA family RNA methyltransferase [Firmicutes bacterium]|nr:TlyA family RNA methyltransferase [Bacillota bacterium]
MGEKQRLDCLLVARKYFPSREKARTLIMSGKVYVNGRKIVKPGTKVDADAGIMVDYVEDRYVGRGGYKLEKALEEFGVSLKGKIVMDIGASTGGFTDCALKYGAEKVYAVDVGYGQLDWSLRNDPRVINMEKQNIRFLTAEAIEDKIDFVTVDVSFISLKLVFPVIKALAAGEVIALIKPQFEVGKGQVGKGGIVKDASLHEQALRDVTAAALDTGYYLENLTYSPVKGAKGNIEFLAYYSLKVNGEPVSFKDVVSAAHNYFIREKSCSPED